MENNKKIRSARCSAEQYAQMVNFIDQNKILILGKTSLEESKECEVKWKELSVILNGLKLLDSRRGLLWNTLYKSKVKGHARNLIREQRGTRGGTKNIKDLSETEEKLMSNIGWVSTSGEPQLEEPGIKATEKNKGNGSNESENNFLVLDEIIVANEVTNVDAGIDQIYFEFEAPEKEIPVKETPVLRKTARKIIHKTKGESIKLNELRTAANIFEKKNSNQLCKCLENLANSIHALANANQNIATAMSQAEKCKEQRAD